jgi:putative OPT family oligopeptide transporter
MTTPLVTSIPAYMLVTGQVIPLLHTGIWMALVAVLGVLFAFPLKKRFINDEQLPFPEGYAAGVVMDNLHNEHGNEGLFKAKLMAIGGMLAGIIQVLREEPVMRAIRLKWLALPEFWDNFVYRFATPRLLGTPLRDLTIRLDSSIVMMGTGGLMGMRTTASLLITATLNYCVLAPIMIHNGVIPKATFKAITTWSLWGGAAMMTTSSLWGFLSKPQIIVQAFAGMLGRSRARSAPDSLADIELPMRVFVIGIPIMGAAVVAAAHVFFGVHIALGILAIPLVFVFTLIAVTSTGLTSITPIGAIAKMTQLTFSVVARGNTGTNIMTAGITADVTGSASNLLMDIKPGYMLGAKPRQQAVGHVLGVIAGSLLSVPVFYTLFHGDISLFTSERLPMPSAQVWRSVAEVLVHGFGSLHPTARIAMAVGAALGVAIEIAGQRTKGRFPLSGVAFGLGFILRFSDALAMGLGALFFWIAARRSRNEEDQQGEQDEPSTFRRVFVDDRETLCAGVIAGGSLAGITLILLETLVLR